jgi:hypothetical protein
MAPALLPILIGLLAGASPPSPLPTADLRYEVDREVRGCPDELQLRTEVNRRLGYAALEVPSSPSVRVILARIVRREGGLVGTVSIRAPDGSEDGQRTMTAADGDCATLVAALALAISIALDAMAAVAPPAPPPPPPSRPPPALEPPPATEPPPPPPPPGALFAGAAVAAGWGMVPGVSPGLVLRAGGRLAQASLALEIRGDLPFRLEPLQRSPGQVVSGTLAGCLHPGPWAACVAASGGAAILGAVGVVPLGSAGARLQYEHAIGERLVLHGALDLHLTVLRVRFVSGGANLWAPPPVSLSAQLGASWSRP